MQSADLQIQSLAAETKLSLADLKLAKGFLGKLVVSAGQVVTDPNLIFALDG